MRENWIEVELGSACQLYQPKTIATKKLVPDGKYNVYGANGIIGTYDKYNHEHSELIMTCRGATCGNIHITKPYSWINGNAMVLRPIAKNTLEISFLRYILSNKQVVQKSIGGTAQPQITRTSLSPTKIPLPPLPEQRAIVAKIEQLFSELDHGVAQLKKAQAQLKVYKQAVLKKAFEGELTKEWREQNLSDDISNTILAAEPKSNYNNQTLIPEGWEIVSLGDVCEKAEKVKRKEINLKNEFKYIDIGGIDNTLNRIISHKSFTWDNAPSRAQQIIKLGDTLFSTVRTYLKNIAMVQKREYNNEICSSGFTVIRGKKDILEPKFIFHLSLFHGFLQPLNKLQTGTSYPAVRDKDVFSQKIKLPTIKEQVKIVEEIESRFSVCDAVEKDLTVNLQKAESLRQSILKQAFEGKLLTKAEIEACKKEKDWEPAESLLERIEEETRG